MLLISIIAFSISVSATDNKKIFLPDSSFCGYQNTPNDPFQSYVPLYDLPWMVHIKLSNLDTIYEFADRCSGVLISDRYVLTNAYCGAQAIKVVVGEYQTNESLVCHRSLCVGPKKEIKVEEHIRDGKIENGPYDFSLLRLQEKVIFCDFVKPICLNLNGSEAHRNLYVSGWGASNSNGVMKKWMKYDMVSDDVCYGEETNLKNNVEVANASFICTLPDKLNKDSACNGDHGGPFMYKSDLNQWFAEGVIIEVMYPDDDTNQFNTCTKEKPVNGIRITPRVIEWILSSLRP